LLPQLSLTAAPVTSLPAAAPRPPPACRRQVAPGDTLYEFLVDERSGRWRHWRERIPDWRYPSQLERPKYAQLVIPTLDSVRYEHLLSLVHSQGKATLVRGRGLGGGGGGWRVGALREVVGGEGRQRERVGVSAMWVGTPCRRFPAPADRLGCPGCRRCLPAAHAHNDCANHTGWLALDP
jgi:hypothetical protein